MADKKDEGPGAFHLGKRYEEVEPGLGRLHAAWHVETGHPALLLFPADQMQWSPRGTWEVRLDCQPKASTMCLTVVRSPDAPEVAELADLVVVMSAAVQRVEESPDVQAHLFGKTVKPGARSAWRIRGVELFRAATWGAPLAAVVMALGMWLLPPVIVGQGGCQFPMLMGEDMSQTNAPLLSSAETFNPTVVSYRLPSRPFRNQAVAPCKPKPVEFEINGGCWMELSQVSPCAEVFAEYQGKCYVPVSKDRGGRLPQSTEP